MTLVTPDIMCQNCLKDPSSCGNRESLNISAKLNGIQPVNCPGFDFKFPEGYSLDRPLLSNFSPETQHELTGKAPLYPYKPKP